MDANFIDSGDDQKLENRQPPTCETAPSRTRKLRKGPQLIPELQLRSHRSIPSRVNFPRIIALQAPKQRTASFSGLRINAPNLIRQLEFPFVLLVPVAILATFFPITGINALLQILPHNEPN
jgi:hypothetical protein